MIVSMLDDKLLDIYRQHCITTDHEATTIQQIQDRINEGFYVFLRKGTVERDLENTITAVNESNASRFAFCTDDKLVNTLLDEGGINGCIRKAIKHGIHHETAYTMASFNAAGSFIPNPIKDQLKLVVIERYRNTGKIGKAIVKGFKLTKGAIASTIAHDSHNVIAVGTNDDDLYAAIDHLKQIGGGITIFNDQYELAILPLKIGGLMSEISFSETRKKLDSIVKAYHSISKPIKFDTFITLSFLALPVIPTLKLTARGFI